MTPQWREELAASKLVGSTSVSGPFGGAADERRHLDRSYLERQQNQTGSNFHRFTR